MQIYMNFGEDLERMVLEQLLDVGYVPKPKDDALSRHVELLERQRRLVAAKPYRVSRSRQLEASPAHRRLRTVLDEITDRLESGLTIQPYLSKSSERLGFKDDLLTHWGLHHLHLSPLATCGPDGYVARADDLLFFRVRDDRAFLVDILPHQLPGNATLVQDRLLRIVEDNWPSLHLQVNAVGPERALSPTGIKAQRKARSNVFVRMRGRSVIPGLGAMTSGHSIRSVWSADRIAEDLRALPDLVRFNYSNWFGPARAPCTVVTLVAVDERSFTLEDSATGRTCVLEKQPLPFNP